MRPRRSRFVLPAETSPPTPLNESAVDADDESESDPDGVPLAARRGRLSLSAAAHQVWVRKKTRRWQSALAGAAAGGVAIMCEREGNRLGVAQQMFVRCVLFFSAFPFPPACSSRFPPSLRHGDVN